MEIIKSRKNFWVSEIGNEQPNMNESFQQWNLQTVAENAGQLRSRKEKKIVEVESENGNAQRSCTMLLYVRPILNVLYWTFFSPSKFILDKDTRSYTRVEGGVFRKVMMALLQIGTIFFLWNNLQRLGQTSNLGVVFRVMYVCFIMLDITFYCVLWKNGEPINRLLLRIRDLCSELCKDAERKPQRRARLATLVWTLVAIYSTYTIVYSLVMEVNWGRWSGISTPGQILRASTRNAEAMIHYGTGLLGPPPSNSTGDEYALGYALALGVPNLMIVLYATASWAYAFLMIILWSLLFRRLFQLYFDSLQRFERSGDRQELLQHVRLFQKITILIDDYNRIFGANNLFCVVSCLLWLAMNLWDIFTKFFSNLALNLLLFPIFINFSFLLITASEVHNTANEVTMLMKVHFQNKETENNMVSLQMQIDQEMIGHELTQVLGMIQHDLQHNHTGLKGYGFFTISYTFVGTVISVLVTYTVMFQQLGNNSASQTE